MNSNIVPSSAPALEVSIPPNPQINVPVAPSHVANVPESVQPPANPQPKTTTKEAVPQAEIKPVPNVNQLTADKNNAALYMEMRKDDYFPANFGQQHGDQALICYKDYCRLYYSNIVLINQVQAYA